MSNALLEEIWWQHGWWVIDGVWFMDDRSLYLKVNGWWVGGLESWDPYMTGFIRVPRIQSHQATQLIEASGAGDWWYTMMCSDETRLNHNEIALDPDTRVQYVWSTTKAQWLRVEWLRLWQQWRWCLMTLHDTLNLRSWWNMTTHIL